MFFDKDNKTRTLYFKSTRKWRLLENGDQDRGSFRVLGSGSYHDGAQFFYGSSLLSLRRNLKD